MHHLYRHFDKDGVLLYVGISLSATKRLEQHMRQAHWSDLIVRVEVEHFETRLKAVEAEGHAIRTENPKHNVKIPSVVEAKIERIRAGQGNPLRQWLDAATVEERDALVLAAGTTLGALRQKAGGYRSGGKVTLSADLAIRIEKASLGIHREGLPELRRVDLCVECGQCEFALC